MPTHLASGTLENYARALHRQRRHRIRLGAGRIEGTGAGQTRNSDFPFDLGVIRLEISVGDGPIPEVRSRDGSHFGAFNKIDFVKTPKICGEMNAGAANTATVHQRSLRLNLFARIFAETSRMDF